MHDEAQGKESDPSSMCCNIFDFIWFSSYKVCRLLDNSDVWDLVSTDGEESMQIELVMEVVELRCVYVASFPAGRGGDPCTHLIYIHNTYCDIKHCHTTHTMSISHFNCVKR